MNAVVNMQQRRTVAAGRQNRDPNKSGSENELTPKKVSADVENSIHEVLSHRTNTFGRGREMVSAELHKKLAVENSPPVGMTSPLSGNKLLGGSAKKSEAEVSPSKLFGNKLSISDLRKRRLDLEETRVPLSALNTSTDVEPESDFTDETVGSSVKTEGTFVYTKRQKTDTTPRTPPLTSSFRRRETKEGTPPPGFENYSLCLRRIMTTTTEVSLPLLEQDTNVDSDQFEDGEAMGPSISEDDSDPYGFNCVKRDLEESNALVVWGEPATPVHFPEEPPFSLLPESPRKSHGLMNLGNTCYMNVIIQCLYNLPSFVYGMERFFGSLVKENVFEGLGTLFTSDVDSLHVALLKVFHDLKRAKRYDTVNPNVLKDAFAKQQSSFWGCIQQDAHEFFCSLIDQVQEGVSSELKKLYSTDVGRPKLETVCPTTQNFSCLVRNNLTCAGCGNVSSVEETYRDFCLALPEERTGESQNCSLESLLNLYFQETTMSRKCVNCGGEDAKAQTQILKLPHVLVLQLKRLHMDRDVPCTKVSAPVKFTSHLDIGPWCAQDKQKFWTPTLIDIAYPESHDSTESTGTIPSGGSLDWDFSTSEGSLDFGSSSSFDLGSQELYSAPIVDSRNVSTCYRLRGVVNHLGFTASTGHFLTDVLDTEADTWIRCDDSLVYDVPKDSVFANEREAYMFFYVHDPVLRVKEKLD